MTVTVTHNDPFIDVTRGPFNARGNGVDDDTEAIQSALDVVRLAGGGTVVVPGGTYLVNLAAHPQDADYGAALVIGSNTRFIVDPGATIKLKNSATNVGTQRQLLINYDIGAGDETIVIEGGTFDGNAANNTGFVLHGLLMIRVHGFTARDVTVTNCRGTAASGANETFHFEFQLGRRAVYESCETVGTAGSTASGFSANTATDVQYVSCRARGMSVGSGFTHNTCRNVRSVGCVAQDNGLHGFNSEGVGDVSYVGCIAGSEGPDTSGSDPYGFTDAESFGNAGFGFAVSGTVAAELIGCVSRKNDAGLYVASGGSVRVRGGDYSANTNNGIHFESTAESIASEVDGPRCVGNANPLAYPGVPFPTRGLLPAPSVPGNGVALPNPYPFACDVYVTGGTVTAIAIEGSVTGLVPPAYVRVPAGKYIMFGHSSAPTWAWFAS